MALQYFQLTGQPERTRFVAFENAYHGDTLGAASLGGVKAFHGRFARIIFRSSTWHSVAELDGIRRSRGNRRGRDRAADPRRGRACGSGRAGCSRSCARWCDAHGVLLIRDEVMTGFGRTGTHVRVSAGKCGAGFPRAGKGTDRRLPAAGRDADDGEDLHGFLGKPRETKTFYYGHSYAGNQLGCAAALGSLAVFREEKVLENLQGKIALLSKLLRNIEASQNVRETRQCGFIAGIDVARADSTPFNPAMQTGARVCAAARRYGLLTRPIRDTIVLMPPFCISETQLRRAADAISAAIREVAG